MVELIGPRLIDPTIHSAEILDMFIHSEDKEKIEKILRTRCLVIVHHPQMFKQLHSMVHHSKTERDTVLLDEDPATPIIVTEIRPSQDSQQSKQSNTFSDDDFGVAPELCGEENFIVL